MDIKSLPRDVRSQLRSGANINSITQCVTELVLNSLDAKSTAIAIRINLLTFRIQVVDNGRGVTKSNMNLIGIRYMTSKCRSLDDLKKIKRFGFRGEALASIVTVSKKMNVTSRPDMVENTYSKSFENGKWQAVELVKQRPSKGTTITIEEFMYNLPVRQKRIEQNLDMLDIKRNLESVAVIHPNVSLNLRNDATGKVIFQSNKTPTVSHVLINLYPEISLDDLMEIKITKSKISVSGLISKKHSNINKIQFIYLNKRRIASPKIQNLVNSLLMESLIYQKRSCREKLLNFPSPVEKPEHPIYVINIRCPYSEIDLTVSPSKKSVEFKDWNVVLKCVEKAVMNLLKYENFINVSSSVHEADLPRASSFKSQFGVSQIAGAVKSIPVKRKIVENETKRSGTCLKINNSKSEIYDLKEHMNSQSMIKTSTEDLVQIVTLAEVYDGSSTAQGGRREQQKSSDHKNNGLVSTIDGSTGASLGSKTCKVKTKKTKRSGRTIKSPNKERGIKILPGTTNYRRKRVNERPTLFAITEVAQKGKLKKDCNVKVSTNKTTNSKRRSIENNIHNIDQIFQNINTDIKSNLHATNLNQNYPNEIRATSIFERHKNTQSLVLNSELNATKPVDNPLLDSTINTDLIQNQTKGKDLIMDMFLKSTLVFPHEEPPVKDNAMEKIVVETTTENFIAECRNQNTTMMTMSWKSMFKRTIVTNSVRPVANLNENVPHDLPLSNKPNFTHYQRNEQNLRENMTSKCNNRIDNDYNKVTVPLYQSYNPNQLVEHLNNQPNFIQDKPFAVRPKRDQYLPTYRNRECNFPSNNDENYGFINNQNCYQMDNSSNLKNELYHSIFRDWYESINTDNQRKHSTNIYGDPFKRKPKIPKQTYEPFHEAKRDHGRKDIIEIDSMFRRPSEYHHYAPPHARRNNQAVYENRAYHAYESEAAKQKQMDQHLPGWGATPYISPYFRKVQEDAPVRKFRKINTMRCNEKHISVKEKEPTYLVKHYQTADQFDFTFVIPSPKANVVPCEQYPNKNGFLLRKHLQQPFLNLKETSPFWQKQNVFQRKETYIKRKTQNQMPEACKDVLVKRSSKPENVFPVQYADQELYNDRMFFEDQRKTFDMYNEAPCEQHLNNNGILFQKYPQQPFVSLQETSPFGQKQNVFQKKETQVQCKIPEVYKDVFVKRASEQGNVFLGQYADKKLHDNRTFFEDQGKTFDMYNEAPCEQHLNNNRLLFQKLPQQPFKKETQVQCKIPEVCKDVFVKRASEQGNLFLGQYADKKLHDNRTFFKDQGIFFGQPQNNLENLKDKPHTNWNLIAPQARKNLHTRTKLPLKRFSTEPPQPTSKTFFKTLSDVNHHVPQTNFIFDTKLSANPLISLEENVEGFNFSSPSNQSFIDLATPPCNNQMEHSFLTPNINLSSTVNNSRKSVNLGGFENTANNEDDEERSNLTLCSKNFKPRLSSTKLGAFDENDANLLNITPEKQKKFDLDSDVIEGTPIGNFEDLFVASLNQMKVKHVGGDSPISCYGNNCNNKKCSSALNISISTAKKSNLILKGMEEECKLNRQTESEGSEQLRNIFQNLEADKALNDAGMENKMQYGLEEATNDDEWIEKVNTFGEIYYVHKRTGMTSTFKPQQHSHFNLIKRIEFVPKGLSPIFIESEKIDVSLSPTSKKSLHAAILENYENELNTVKWSNYIYNYDVANAFFQELYREKTKQFECHIPNANLNEFPRSMARLCNKMKAQSFSKDIFTELEIIGQLDNKFIVTVLANTKLVILFDQHAVHERVRLEQFLNDYKETEAEDGTIKFKRTQSPEKIVLSLTSSEIDIVTNFKNVFEMLGFQYTVCGHAIEITHIPTCIFNKFGRNKQMKKTECLLDITSLIYEQITMLMSTRGVSLKTPNVLHRIINSEACRGAVKFGDMLTRSECEKHLKDLSKCHLPFQCAHGRPTLIPIVDTTQNVKVNARKPNLKKLKPNDKPQNKT